MSNFSQNNVNFTIENNFQTGEKKHVVKGKLTSGINDYLGYEADDASKLVNAVDIDWNNAELSPSDNPTEGLEYQTINSTGQILKNIENLQAQVNVLTTLVKGLYNALQA